MDLGQAELLKQAKGQMYIQQSTDLELLKQLKDLGIVKYKTSAFEVEFFRPLAVQQDLKDNRTLEEIEKASKEAYESLLFMSSN